MKVISVLERVAIVGGTTFLFAIVPLALGGEYPAMRPLHVVFVGVVFCPIGAFVGHYLWKKWSGPETKAP